MPIKAQIKELTMTDSTPVAAAAPAVAAPKTPKPKTTLENMAARKVFDSTDATMAYLANCAETFSDFNDSDQTIIIPFRDAEGGLDAEKYDADGYEVMVATLKERVTTPGNAAVTTLKAIVITPIPSLELLMDSAEGQAFVAEIVRKELNHRAVRQLRVAENPVTVADQIPYTVTAFVSSSREDSGIIEAYNDLYKHINDTLAKAAPAWKRRKLTKAELRAALESKAFALDSYPELEEAGPNGSLFVMALKLGAMTADKKGLDSTIFTRWLESRDAAAFEPGAVEEEKPLDFDSLAEAMLAEPKPADPAPAGEATGEEAKPEAEATA